MLGPTGSFAVALALDLRVSRCQCLTASAAWYCSVHSASLWVIEGPCLCPEDLTFCLILRKTSQTICGAGLGSGFFTFQFRSVFISFIVLQLQSLRGQNQGAVRAMLRLKPAAGVLLVSCSFWRPANNPRLSVVCSCRTVVTAPVTMWHSPHMALSFHGILSYILDPSSLRALIQ